MAADDVVSSASTEPEEKSMVVDRSRSVTISEPAVPLPPVDASAEKS